jgi:signal transduction histidine kinase
MTHLKILIVKINKLIERLQKTNDHNQRSEEAKKKMISNISHDLRTPLTSMLGYLELILEDRNIEDRRKALSEKKKEEYLRIVYNKGNYLYDLMEEFFQVSKLDSNDMRLEMKKINISEVIRENIISFFNEIQKLDIQPEINIPDEDFYVLGDEKALNRIFTNLINNALKHGIKATIIGVKLNCDEKNIIIDIYDNGAGIPDNEINYVFDRLYIVEKSRSLNTKGSGLGLTIVKKLVEALGGKITVSSSPFEKTTFTVVLPRLVTVTNNSLM